MTEAPLATPPAQARSDGQMELIVGRLLRLGVLAAAGVVIVGAFFLLSRYGGQTADFRSFAGEPQALTSLGGIIRAALAGESRAIVQLGLLMLIATPVARVAITLVVFVYHRDRLYIFVTALVLALLLYGLIFGPG